MKKYIDFDLKAIPCDRIEACKMALLKKSKNALDANFIEGMACIGGCNVGAGFLLTAKRIRRKLINTEEKLFEKTLQR